jgi:hypothetical protein
MLGELRSGRFIDRTNVLLGLSALFQGIVFLHLKRKSGFEGLTEDFCLDAAREQGLEKKIIEKGMR